MVTNAPPSIGQFTIGGISEIFALPKLIGAFLLTFMGKADNAVKETLAYFKGFFMALIGSPLISTSVFTFSRASLNINLERSMVPKRLETAGYLQPFRFSKYRAGPCCS